MENLTEKEQDNLTRYERIKKAFGVDNERELAQKLDVHVPQIYRMKKRGFYPSTKRLIDFLLGKLEKKHEKPNKKEKHAKTDSKA